MFVVTVVPVSRGVFKETLTFFSKEPITPGSMVTAPVRNKKTQVFVLKNEAVSDAKLSLRTSSYALKKIDGAKGVKIVSEATMRAFSETARVHALPLGVIAAHHIPSTILSNTQELVGDAPEPPASDTEPETVALQATFEERVRLYRNIVRGAFANGKSVYIATATIAEAEALRDVLERGIHDQVRVCTSALTKKQTLELWNEALAAKAPYVYIGTRSFVTLPNTPFDSFIIERETARPFVQQKHPRIDSRVLIQHLAKNVGARCILADFPLSIATRHRLEETDIDEMTRLQVSSHAQATAKVIDTRTKKDPDKPQTAKKRFSPLAEQTRTHIEKALTDGQHVFLYASRKGLAPVTVCNDCGTPVVDETTGVPMTLHKTSVGNVFLSHRSGAVMKANVCCASCGSWNLVSLGIGVERVFDEGTKTVSRSTDCNANR